jgi:hypothetical protein
MRNAFFFVCSRAAQSRLTRIAMVATTVVNSITVKPVKEKATRLGIPAASAFWAPWRVILIWAVCKLSGSMISVTSCHNAFNSDRTSDRAFGYAQCGC